MIASRLVLHPAAILGFLAALPILLAGYVPIDWHIDRTLHPVGRDFVNLWVGGRLILEGAWQTLFDRAAYLDALHRLFDPQLSRHVWSYPPTSFLWAAPLGALPYSLALGLWTISGLTALLVVARHGLEATAARCTTIMLLLAPATLLNVLCGQNGFYTAALMAGGILMLDRRPLVAGVLIGLLSYKPHFGIVIAPALIALGAWRTVATAAATAIAMVLLSMALFGVEPWGAFLRETVPHQGHVLQKFVGFFTTMLVSPYAALRSLDASHPVAQGLQAVLTGAVVLGCALAVRRTDDADTRLTLIVAATFLATPYALTYDMPVVALVIARLYARAPEAKWSPVEAMVYGGVWAIPLASMPLSIVGLPLTPLLMVALFTCNINRLIDIGVPSLGLSWFLSGSARQRVDCDSRSC